MGVPILDLLIEERPNLIIFTDLCVKAIDETRDSSSVIPFSFCIGDLTYEVSDSARLDSAIQRVC
jgi:hypothetical protein